MPIKGWKGDRIKQSCTLSRLLEVADSQLKEMTLVLNEKRCPADRLIHGDNLIGLSVYTIFG